MRISYRLTLAANGNSLHYTGTWQPRGLLLRIVAPVLGFLGRRHASDALARLKELAEARRGSEPHTARGDRPVRVEEERSADGEIRPTTEDVGFVVSSDC
ncbi:MAG: hypothetical protein V3T72_19450 [Thermoanaerobaculia bacterium]